MTLYFFSLITPFSPTISSFFLSFFLFIIIIFFFFFFFFIFFPSHHPCPCATPRCSVVQVCLLGVGESLERVVCGVVCLRGHHRGLRAELRVHEGRVRGVRDGGEPRRGHTLAQQGGEVQWTEPHTRPRLTRTQTRGRITVQALDTQHER